MTGVAVGIVHVFETLADLAVHHLFLMALLAGQRLMLAQQGEMGFPVVKGFGILKTVETMAFRTIGRHFTLVEIVVTSQTRFVQAQKSRFFPFQPRVSNVFGIVAALAIQRSMHALFFKSCFSVVKRCFVNIDEPERATVMLVVAGITILAQHFC